MDNVGGGSAIRPNVRGMTDWDVPGFDVLDLIGFGTNGEVWRARDRRTGSLVVLRRLAGGDAAAVTAVKAQATIVRSLPTPHLIRLRSTTRAGRDDVLVMDHAAGGSLAALLLRRGRLEPGEVVTAVAPIAEALGQAHGHDLVHGRLRAASVLLDANGRPLLDGLGLAALHDPEDGLDPTGGLGPAADVWALGALAHLLLTGEEPGTTVLDMLAPRAPRPLVRTIESALGFDPTTRPSAADLAAALLAACPPLPIEGLAPVPEPARPVPRSGIAAPARRRVGAVAAVGLAITAVSAAGWAWGARTSEHATRVSAAPHATVTPHPDWRAVLERLDSSRAQAFSHADARLLDSVYAPGAPGAAADRRALAALAELRRTALGVEHEVSRVTPLSVTGMRAELQVVEALGAFEVLDGAGRVVEQHRAGGPNTHRVVLVATSHGWRVQQVRTAA